ncbi:MAG: DUF4129 domain-containing protein [Chloroflexota bacterium]|nr:DUF4129 domain-containing protein [Chloroflexota bacterium]
MKQIVARFLRILTPRRVGFSLLTVALLGALGWFLISSGSRAPRVIGQPPLRPALGKQLAYSNYTAVISKALADVQASLALPADKRKEALLVVANDLEHEEGAEVTTPGGEAAEIDNSVMIAEMRADTPNAGAIELGLEALSKSLAGKGAGLEGTLVGGKAEETLRQILSDSRFDYERQLSPLQRLIRWLSEHSGGGTGDDNLSSIFIAILAGLAAGVLTFLASEKLGGKVLRLGLSIAVGTVTGLIFYAGLNAIGTTLKILGVVGLIVAAVAIGLVGSGLGRASTPAAPRRLNDLATVLGMSAGEARRRAEEAASEGDYRLAIRYRCLGLLLALDEVGMLHFDRAATNREYLFRAPGEMQNRLQPLLDRFDAVWYGGAPATAQEWAQYTAEAAGIEAMLPAASARGRRGDSAA